MYSERVIKVLQGKPDDIESIILAIDYGLCRFVPPDESPDLKVHVPYYLVVLGVAPTPYGLEILHQPRY